jgi:hypothetical protein
VSVDEATLRDLATFARIEVESGDLEPWAALLRELPVEPERRAWLVKLYNAYDDFGSAWSVDRRWPSPKAWLNAEDLHEAADYPCTQERRGLRGGRIIRHLMSYVMALRGLTQINWMDRALLREASTPEHDWERLTWLTKQIWGVGRQTAFEWCEFAEKVLEFPIRAPDAALWDSEGPRRSLESLYGPEGRVTARWLDDRARECRAFLAECGVNLTWEDFETVICDFHVMRAGRYYPGRHLAALRAEIEQQPERDFLLTAWYRVIPEPWCEIAPGIDGAKLDAYRRSASIVCAP